MTSLKKTILNRSFRLLYLSAMLMVSLFSCKPLEEGTQTLPPDENRFTTTVLTLPGQLDEPMAFTFLNANRLLLVERKGNVKSFDVNTKAVKTLATIPVNMKYTSKEGVVREAEEGLMGIVAHPDFEKNHWIYLYYADPDETKHVLARWELHGDSLYPASKKILLEVPTQREVCCHTGGGMVFDKEGNLFLTTGNNTANPRQGTSALDEREGRSSWDDQRTAGNTNDLRGKILRIHPESDGNYAIPEGNLFPKGTAKTRPEIYTMGHRNPWRVSIDHKTGYIYWGEVGPDASKDSIIGPRGYDEFNQARQPGFFGWPYFIADNKPYAAYDYATDVIGEKFDAAKPVNHSPNNTGLTELPPPQKAFIWYPYGVSEEFPLVGSAGRSATGGPVFRKADFEASDKRFPAYFEGKWFIVEFMRGWIMAVSMDEEGNYKSMERFLSNEDFGSAIDMKFSPDGDLYVLEYGSAWFRGNDNALIKRIEYNAGNRPPVVKASADQLAGALPLSIQLSSEGTIDYDQDKLSYEWTIKSENGFAKTIKEANPTLTLDQEGTYTVSLQVTDSHQNSSTQSLEVKAGNEPPLVDINITSGNKTFFFPDNRLTYAIRVSDKEDGTLEQGQINKEEVAINFDYAPEGYDPIEIAQNHRSSDEWIAFSKGQALINQSDCKACHLVDKKSVGPSYVDIAKKYKHDLPAQVTIANKIITGGSGVWGEHAMSAHPQFSPQETALMVDYIIGLNDPQRAPQSIPFAGNFTTRIPEGDNGKGAYLLRVAYTDKGALSLGPQTSEDIIPLRNPVINPEKYDVSSGTQLMTTPSRSFNLVGHKSYLGFKNIDLTGIKQISFVGQALPRVGAAGGEIAVYLDSPEGKLIGKTEQVVPKEVDFRAAMEKINAERKKAGQEPVGFGALRELLVSKVNAPLETVEGIHDIYFVFENPNAQPGQILMQVQEIEFQQQSTALVQ